jgi:hypothetical protein
MWVSLHHTIILLFTTAVLFYLLPKCKIHWQILIILIWLWGVSWLMSANYKTNDNQIFIPSKNHLMEI